jgi:polysaccharide deacetylase family protein (PEP-CTERM system associated)
MPQVFLTRTMSNQGSEAAARFAAAMKKPAAAMKKPAAAMKAPAAMKTPAATMPRPAAGSVESVFSIDVEDWFHILQVPGAPPMLSWDFLPSRVEHNFMRLLDLLSVHNVQATCFFLGWIAQRYPHLVRAAMERGHEIASHGYAHRLVFQMTARRFREDSIRARRILEDVAGCPVLGYRAAGFSVIDKTPWFFETLLEAGYEYDSSVFPAARQHGGMKAAHLGPHCIVSKSGTLIEFPISVADVYPRPTCFFGGGYLRLFPLWLIRHGGERAVARQAGHLLRASARDRPRSPAAAHAAASKIQILRQFGDH